MSHRDSTRDVTREVTRLVRGEGADRVFWEIARSGAVIVIRFGRALSRGRSTEKVLGDEAEAKRVFAKLVFAKRKDGYVDPPATVTAGTSSRKGVSLRNADLERMIEEAPADPAGYLVYADWLQQRGDPRGELIVVQHRRASAPDDGALERAESTLIKTYAAELLGPLARYAYIRTAERSYRAFAWRHGFIRAARLRRIAETKLSEVVAALLTHPSGRFLERLILGRPYFGEAEEADLEGVYAALAAHAPRTLDRVVVGDGFVAVGDLRRLFAALPHLRRLAIAGPQAMLHAVKAEALEQLVFGVAGHDEIGGVAAARWPALEELALTLATPSASTEEALEPLFRTDGLPKLQRLAVRRWMLDAEDRLMTQDAVALGLARFAASRGLEGLSLEMPLSDVGARALARLGPSLAGTAIVVPRVGVATGAASVLEAALPGLVWVDEPVEVALGDVDAVEPDALDDGRRPGP